MIGRPRFGCGDDVGAEHLHGIEVEAAEERPGGDVVGDGIRLGRPADERHAGDRRFRRRQAIRAHAVDPYRANRGANRRFGGQPASFL
jgi:hypothetical protein